MYDAITGHIVVVDDEQEMRDYLAEVLTLHGYRCLLFADGNAALSHLAANGDSASLILSDIKMPGMSGVELLRTVKAVAPELPFILFSGIYEQSLAMDALRTGATDYLLKPALPSEIIALIAKHLRGPESETQMAVRRALIRFLHALKLAGTSGAGQLAPLYDTLGIKRFETLQHSQRVAAYSRLIGTVHGLDEKALGELEIGALLHDIGKAAIPHNVLMKPGKLNGEEWRVMKTHAQIGAELLATVPGIANEAEIVYCHHERVDGRGYPRGLSKDEMPIGARIFAVADTLDAITSNRPYRKSLSLTQAREEIDRMNRTNFDPRVVESFHRVPDGELEAVRLLHPDQSEPAGLDFIPRGMPVPGAPELVGVGL
jgi:response regulator RpfG family c-di-GMP phosphodiesterase